MIGVDTCFLIDILRKDDILGDILIPDDDLVICSLVYFEFLLGCTDKEAKIFEEMIQPFIKIDATFESMKIAAQNYKQLKTQGLVISQADCVIAATYLNHGITQILTRNRKHFERIEGLQIINYAKELNNQTI
jgi:predicted nucleic acid-binding protein